MSKIAGGKDRSPKQVRTVLGNPFVNGQARFPRNDEVQDDAVDGFG